MSVQRNFSDCWISTCPIPDSKTFDLTEENAGSEFVISIDTRDLWSLYSPSAYCQKHHFTFICKFLFLSCKCNCFLNPLFSIVNRLTWNYECYVSGYTELSLGDQVHLIECCWMELLLLNCAFRSMEHCGRRLVIAPDLVLERWESKCVFVCCLKDTTEGIGGGWGCSVRSIEVRDICNHWYLL